MGQPGDGARQGQGLWGDIQNFQNPHGDFGAPATGPGAARLPRAPVPVVPPSEESIETLVVRLYGVDFYYKDVSLFVLPRIFVATFRYPSA